MGKRLGLAWLGVAACAGIGSAALLPVSLALCAWSCAVVRRGARGEYDGR